MKILLLSATDAEIGTFREAYSNIDILIGGVGVPATIYSLVERLNNNRPDLVMQAGIAGVFPGSDLSIGDVVLVQKDCFGDLGAVQHQKFQTIHEMGFSNESEWLINEYSLLHRLPFKQVSAITVNTVTDNLQLVQIFRQKWRADIESMEGAALHFVCTKQEIPFLQLRCISNTVGTRDKSQWRIKEAIENLSNALFQVMQVLETSC